MAGITCNRFTSSNFIKLCKKVIVRYKSDAHIAMTDDTSTIVCWHPEQNFPYEFSKPLPEKALVEKSDSVLKIQSNKHLLSVFKPKRREEVLEELARITFTTKHRWYPPRQQFRRRQKIEMDRPYL